MGFKQPRTLEDEDNLGRKVGILGGPVEEDEKEQFLQTYRWVQGNHTRPLPVSMTKGIVCEGVPKLRETE